MLKKLIKHEFKAVSKILCLLHLALIIVTAVEFVIIKLLSNSYISIISTTAITVYGALIFIITAAILIYFIVHFYRTMFTDQGYLTNTLPVKPYELIISKMLVAFVWIIINSIITIISIIMIVNANGATHYFTKIINEAANEFHNQFGINFNALAIIFIIYMISTAVYMLLMLYASIALGQSMGRHKILCSFAAYMILYTVNQALSAAILVPFGLYGVIDKIEISTIIMPLIVVSFIFLLILSVIYFIITNHILCSKLNLE